MYNSRAWVLSAGSRSLMPFLLCGQELSSIVHSVYMNRACTLWKLLVVLPKIELDINKRPWDTLPTFSLWDVWLRWEYCTWNSQVYCSEGKKKKNESNVHPLNRNCLSSSYMPGTVLSSWHTVKNERLYSFLMEYLYLYILRFNIIIITLSIPRHTSKSFSSSSQLFHYFPYSEKKKKKDCKQHRPLQISRCCIV